MSEKPPSTRSSIDPLRAAAANGLRHARRVVVAVTGGTVVLAGAVMLLTPGPGLLGIALGLAILGVEFAWARRLLVRVKETMRGSRAAKGSDSPKDDGERPAGPATDAAARRERA